MIDFERLQPEAVEFYEGEFDRELIFEDRTAVQLLKRAAKARISLRCEQGNEPFEGDDYIAGLPDSVPSMAMSAKWVGEYIELLGHYVHVGFLNDESRNPEVVDMSRFQAGQLSSELATGSEAFDLAAKLDYDAFFDDRAA